MQGLKDARVPVRRISPKDESHYFYGYYDTLAFDPTDRYHLCTKVGFWDRLPREDDVAELGMIDVETGKYAPLAATTAWNFQQSAMLQWNPANPASEIIFNARRGSDYYGVVLNIQTGARRELDRPVANVSGDGRWGVSINFNRVFDFRAGYGYAGVRDPYYDVPQPEDDGVFLIDMQTGKSRLILSFAQMGEGLKGDVPDADGRKLVINPVTFNTDGSRIFVLVRTFPDSGSLWHSGMCTIDRNGGGFYKLKPYSYTSHYNWRDRDHLLCYSSTEKGTGLFLYTDQSRETLRYSPEFFTMDLHCSYGRDKRYIVGDGYPDSDLSRPMFFYDTETNRGMQLFRVKSQPLCEGDIRCDLHTRWSHDGRRLSFDSTHEGYRGVYLADISALVQR